MLECVNYSSDRGIYIIVNDISNKIYYFKEAEIECMVKNGIDIENIGLNEEKLEYTGEVADSNSIGIMILDEVDVLNKIKIKDTLNREIILDTDEVIQKIKSGEYFPINFKVE